MAKVITNDGDNIINLDAKVGVKGSNTTGDVVVVQAMLKYLTQFHKKWTRANIPEPNGYLDPNTQQAIFDYQDHVRSTPGQPEYVWVARDGSISPYRNNVGLMRKQAWTIIKMNNECDTLAAAKRDGDHIDALCRRWPQVAKALGRNPSFL